MISVIIPVYNVEPYLDKCLASVEKQSYTDWECILIDDGSIDRSGIICDRWALRDSRFKVIHKKNEGVSVARNIGIEKAKGEYICFIDSDDWVEKNYLLDMVERMNEQNVDLVVSGIRSIQDGIEKSDVRPHKKTTYSLNDQHAEDFMDDIDLMYGPWIKLYKKSIIKEYNISFPQHLSLGEDMLFNFAYLEHVNSIATILNSNYAYRRLDRNSLSTKEYDAIFDIWIEHWNVRVNFLRGKHMWCEKADLYFGQHLWGIVYDSIFGVKNVSYADIKRILKTVDIDILIRQKNGFICSNWIKTLILKRYSLLIFIVSKMR